MNKVSVKIEEKVKKPIESQMKNECPPKDSSD